MKIIIIDDNKQHVELVGDKARKIILDNDIQSLMYPKEGKYLLYNPKGTWKPYCPICSKLRAQVDNRK